MNNNLDDDQLQFAHLVSNDFLLFVDWAFTYLHPGQELAMNWHLEVLAELARQIEEGELRQLMAALPPRSLKSFIFSVCLVAYLLGKRPGTQFICASYGAALAAQHSADCRKIMTSDWYKLAFPNTKISTSKSTESYFETTANGSRRAVSAGGSVTGFGGDAIIADDLVSADDADNLKVHEERTSWFFNSLLTRLNNPNKGIVVVIGQRLHFHDVMAKIAEAMPMKQIVIPAEAEKDLFYELAGGKTHIFKVGDVLHKALMDADALKLRRRSMGDAHYRSQYLLDPPPNGGQIVNPKWFKRFAKARPYDYRVISIDPAFTPNGGDFSAAIVCNVVGKDIEIIHGEQVQKGPGPLAKWVRALDIKWQPDLIVIEGIAGGAVFVQQLRDMRMDHVFGLSSHGPNGKLQRMEDVAPQIEAGRVWLPHDGEFVQPFIDSIAQFPNGKADDWPDSLSQLLLNFDKLLPLAEYHHSRRCPAMPERRKSAYYQRYWV